MSTRAAFRLSDALASSAILLVALCDLLIRETYHRVSAEALGMLIVMLVWLATAAALVLRGRARSEQTRDRIGRGAVLAAAAASGWLLAGSAMMALVPRASSWGTAVVALCVALAASLALGLIVASQDLWIRTRRVLVVGSIVFLGSQILLAAWQAPRLTWPPAAAPQPNSGRRVATLALLFDELNATAAAPLVELLRSRGLQVEFTSVPSVGDSTSKVVPAMFSGRSFEQARPCGPTSICSSRSVLDFSRIHTSRPDVDVVGFYHPYCAIEGLRSCERVAVGSALFDAERWACALWRRAGLPSDRSAGRCSGVYSRVWGELTAETVAALWRAPVWQQGGLLFAHLPLPHPPGMDAGGSLQSHYRDNLDRMMALVDDMLTRLRRSGLEPRLLIFSDHPLRQQHWCSNYAPYQARRCKPTAALHDERVPIITAGNAAPSLQAIESNAKVFELLAAWR